MSAPSFTYIDHAHVTAGVVIAALGAVGLLLGLVRRIVLLGVVAVVLLLAGAVTFAIALHGTHCTPASHQHVCRTVR